MLLDNETIIFPMSDNSKHFIVDFLFCFYCCVSLISTAALLPPLLAVQLFSLYPVRISTLLCRLLIPFHEIFSTLTAVYICSHIYVYFPHKATAPNTENSTFSDRAHIHSCEFSIYSHIRLYAHAHLLSGVESSLGKMRKLWE